jgi:crossover junction endodeoxyribonuclease RuvC
MNRSALHVTFGIDPGQTGAIAVLVDGDFEDFIDMPLMPRPAGGNQINGAALAESIREVRRRHEGADFLAVLEQVSAMPGQGVSSMFRFGEGFGVVQGVVAALGIPLNMVHPQKWKKTLGLIGKEKDCARTLAIQRFPQAASSLARKKDIGRADALLIASWASTTELAAQLPAMETA